MKNNYFFLLHINRLFPIAGETLSYLTEVIDIWILEYPMQAISDLMQNDEKSSKGRISPQELQYIRHTVKVSGDLKMGKYF